MTLTKPTAGQGSPQGPGFSMKRTQTAMVALWFASSVFLALPEEVIHPL